MSDLTIARPYAKAVFEIAEQNKSFEQWSEQLAFLSAVVSSEAADSVLQSPQLTHEERADALLKVCKDKLDGKAEALIRVLSENNRLSVLPEIESIYQTLSNEAQNVEEVVVTSANKITKPQQKTLEAALSKKLNKAVNVVYETDASMIGGLIVHAGDKVIDSSIQNRIQQLTQQLIK